MNFILSELQRAVDNMLLVGTIKTLDYERYQLTVTVDELTSDWLDWPADIGANYIRHRPLKAGQKVLLACPQGELTQAKIVGFLHWLDEPGIEISPMLDVTQFNDGTWIAYDSEQHALSIDCVGNVSIANEGIVSIQAKNIHLKADNVTIDAKVAINGPVQQSGGDITSDNDIKAGDVSLKQHKHISSSPGKPSSAPTP